MIGAFPLPRSDSIGSFPIRFQLSLGGISCGTYHLPQDKVSNLEISVFDSGVVVLGYKVLVSC